MFRKGCDLVFNSLVDLINQVDSLIPLDSEKVPSIELYMDQVLSIISDELENHKRYASDTIMTKTMINNYVKHGLLPAPIKKKYDKEQIVRLGLIFHLKNVLSLKDIESLFSLATHNDASVEEVYDKFLTHIQNASCWKEHMLEIANQFSPNTPDDFETLFVFLLVILYEAVQTKDLVERILDMYTASLEK